jgi:BRCT domain type II-containing protein
MASEKIVRILKAKSSFSAAEIDVMSDAEGWDWVYANAKPRKEKLTQVCFTGFSAVEKAELSALAATARLEVVGSITKNLAFVCAGENAGPSKLEKAKGQGVHVLNREQFEHLLETGEIQDI